MHNVKTGDCFITAHLTGLAMSYGDFLEQYEGSACLFLDEKDRGIIFVCS